jgi:peptide-methionine (S)-S-oxide reductase
MLAFSWNPWASYRTSREPSASGPYEPPAHVPPGAKSLVVAGGCFWCLDSEFEQLKGVYDVEAAYVGGSQIGVSYEDVCSGTTGDAESVRIFFDPKQISEADLLRIFFVSHNPTTLNAQGPDHGTQYRSAIFYSTPEEKALAEKIRDEIAKAKIWSDPIVTTIEPLKNYTRAEEYHQHYYQKYLHATDAERMTMNAGYCAAIVQPKAVEFRKKFANLLKK